MARRRQTLECGCSSGLAAGPGQTIPWAIHSGQSRHPSLQEHSGAPRLHGLSAVPHTCSHSESPRVREEVSGSEQKLANLWEGHCHVSTEPHTWSWSQLAEGHSPQLRPRAAFQVLPPRAPCPRVRVLTAQPKQSGTVGWTVSGSPPPSTFQHLKILPPLTDGRPPRSQRKLVQEGQGGGDEPYLTSCSSVIFQQTTQPSHLSSQRPPHPCWAPPAF